MKVCLQTAIQEAYPVHNLYVSQQRVCISTPEQNTFVSSANNENFKLVDALHVSFMYNINSYGPIIEPFGTPQVTLNNVDAQSSI